MPNGDDHSEAEPIRIDLNALVRPTTTTFSTAGGLKPPPVAERDEFDRLRRGEGVTIEGPALDAFLEARRLASTAVFRRIELFEKELGGFFTAVRPTLPAKLRGELINPDGSPARLLMLEVLRPEYGPNEAVSDFGWAAPKTVTDSRGKFSVGLPSVPVPERGLRVSVRGRNGRLTLTIPRVDSIDGDLGLHVLDRTLQPLERSVLARLGDLVPVDEEDAEESPEDFTTAQPPLRLGEGDCASEYATEGGTVSRFRYSVLFRLIDPLVGPRVLVRDVKVGANTIPTSVPRKTAVLANMNLASVLASLTKSGKWSFRDRIPIEDPVDVDDFLDDVGRNPRAVPKAASLGLGYITRMRLVGIYKGLSLGQLVYSLPLAPGEEQQIAVFEQRERLSVRERESLSFREQQNFEQSLDTSLDSTFRSAFDETINAGSEMESSSSTGSIGGAGGIGGFLGGVLFGVGVAGGYSSSSTSGSTESWQNTSRDFVASSSEDFHSALERSAAVKREASRTSVRLATATDRQEATTRFIANRNHCHALTMQWFQVLRDVSVESRVEGIDLVCFVPLQLIQFRQPGQSNSLVLGGLSRSSVLARYAGILRHPDVLASTFRRHPRYRRPLRRLREFAGDPEATPSIGFAQDVVTVRLRATIFTFEEISVSLITRNGDRLGPVTLSGAALPIPKDEFSTGQELLEFLRKGRSGEDGFVTLTAGVAIPERISRDDIARFEFRLRTRSFSYRLSQGGSPFSVNEVLNGLGIAQGIQAAIRGANQFLNVNLSSGEIDSVVGPPNIWDVDAKIAGESEVYLDEFSGIVNKTSLPAFLPLPARNVTPTLSRNDLIEIEEMYQHVVRNTVDYSKAVWSSMTPEERAIMLEPYTIGVPQGGLPDGSQDVPLLSAVANKVLGFFGNAMVMPFHIPPDAAKDFGFTTRDIQDALLRFHRQGFSTNRRNLSLPTRGLLGEAVLGRCNACEKIDLTRFWNWKDSTTPAPVGQAPAFPAEAQGANIFAAQGPGLLPQNQPQNVVTIGSSGEPAVPSGAARIAEILKAAPDLAKPGADLTGLATLQKQLAEDTKSAAAGRDKAIDSATDITKTIIGGVKDLELGKQKTEADEKAKKEKEAKEAEAAGTKKKEETQKARSGALETIGKNAGGLAALAAGMEGETAGSAATFASTVFKNAVGESGSLSPVEASSLFAAFNGLKGAQGAPPDAVIDTFITQIINRSKESGGGN